MRKRREGAQDKAHKTGRYDPDRGCRPGMRGKRAGRRLSQPDIPAGSGSKGDIMEQDTNKKEKKEKKEKKRMSNRRFKGVWSTLMAVLAVIMVVATVVTNYYQTIISSYFGQAMTKVIETDENASAEDSIYYTSSYGEDEGELLQEDSYAVAKEIADEGIVLLENIDDTLPLAEGSNVSLFSVGSVNPILGGTGSGSTSSDVSTYDSFTDNGLNVNETLYDFYEDKYNSGYARTYHGVWSSDEWAINEVPVSEFTDAVTASFADYSDAAIVFICREGGENDDIPNNADDDTYTGSTKVADSDDTYLALNQDEKDLIQYLQDSEEFDTIIIIANSNNALELGWTADYDKIKGVIWAGGLGQMGLDSLAQILTGQVNPSGRLVDTYAYDSLSSPAAQNTGNYTYTNTEIIPDDICDDSRLTHYVVYAEGIYVGYRYYETRYEDVVMGQGNAGDYDYASTVQYPFGYGLSYTTFEYSGYTFSYSEEDEEFTVSVTVTNTGDVAGKETVQVYFQSPYTDYDKTYGVEKASVELCGYDKTGILEPGESETLVITVSLEELRTYDSENEEGYILDAGDYYFAVGTDAHEALNNILAEKGYTVEDGMTGEGDASFVGTWTNDTLDTDIFNTSTTYDGEEGAEITNQLDVADINNYGIEYTYLTRSDWEGTFPDAAQLEMNELIVAALESEEYKTSEDDSLEMPTTEAANGVTLIDLMGADYDDELWEDLLDNLSVSELTDMATLGAMKTTGATSINAPDTTCSDGPVGVNSANFGGSNGAGTAFPCIPVLAATFNDELVEAFGTQLGEECLNSGIAGLYGPGADIHRSPYSGRNFEYYSEDPFLSGSMVAIEVQALMSKGVTTYVKHFALNDTEQNRQGVSTWANEQAIREIYLTPFEYAVRYGGTLAMMSSYNRIGAVWTGGCTELMTNILRDEWGFEGAVVTDFVNDRDYQSTIQGLNAGNDIWMDFAVSDSFSAEGNAYIVTELREAAHNILYALVNSNAMNGISKTSTVVKVIPLWQKLLYAGDIAAAAVILLGIFLVRRRVKNHPELNEGTVKIEQA